MCAPLPGSLGPGAQHPRLPSSGSGGGGRKRGQAHLQQGVSPGWQEMGTLELSSQGRAVQLWSVSPRLRAWALGSLRGLPEGKCFSQSTQSCRAHRRGIPDGLGHVLREARSCCDTEIQGCAPLASRAASRVSIGRGRTLPHSKSLCPFPLLGRLLTISWLLVSGSLPTTFSWTLCGCSTPRGVLIAKFRGHFSLVLSSARSPRGPGLLAPGGSSLPSQSLGVLPRPLCCLG